MVQNDADRLINYKTLADAIVRLVGMAPEEFPAAESMADHLLGFFGYQDRVIDNMLDPTDRNMFYQFQDWGLLKTISEETTLWDGREWRIHYWLLNTDKILNWTPQTNIQDGLINTIHYFKTYIIDINLDNF